MRRLALSTENVSAGMAFLLLRLHIRLRAASMPIRDLGIFSKCFLNPDGVMAIVPSSLNLPSSFRQA